MPADGSPPYRLTTRYLGSTSAAGRDFIVFDQLERRRNAGLYSDLYLFDRRSGRVRQLTSEARLLDPDLSPEGGTLACVKDAAGRRDLVLVRLKSDTTPETPPTTLVSASETQFNAPRWSPDGRSIAAERHRPGALSEIVVVDVATRALRVVASDARARIVTPAWRPDGQAVIAAVAPEDAPFNLYEFPLDSRLTPRQLTHRTGGATWPDVSSDGKSIVFVGYTTDGSDIFLMPYPAAPAGALAVDAAALAVANADVGSAFRRIADPSDAIRLKPDPTSRPDPTSKPDPTTETRADLVYRPWRTLKRSIAPAGSWATRCWPSAWAAPAT